MPLPVRNLQLNKDKMNGWMDAKKEREREKEIKRDYNKIIPIFTIWTGEKERVSIPNLPNLKVG